MPRPSKFNPARAARVLAAIADGNHKHVAARLAGVHPETVSNWLKRGEAASTGVFAEFFDGFTRAEAAAEAKAIRAWQEAISQDWRAARDFLARRFPERWADRSRVELTGRDGGPVRTADAEPDLSRLTVEELTALEALSEKIHPASGDDR